MSPFKLVHGFQPPGFLEVKLGLTGQLDKLKDESQKKYLSNLTKILHENNLQAKASLDKYDENRKRRYDKNRKSIGFKKGDLVGRYIPTQDKLKPKFTGPWKIASEPHNNVCKIVKLKDDYSIDTGKRVTVNLEKLRYWSPPKELRGIFGI